MDLLNKKISELQEIIKAGSADIAAPASFLLKCISKKKPDEFLSSIKNDLYYYVDVYKKYKLLNIADLRNCLENINILPCIDIIIILHLIGSVQKKSKIVWPKKEKGKYKKKFSLLPVDIQEDMIGWISNKINEIPEYNVTETVSQFAENDRSIGKGLTANPGPFDWNLTPYLREIADCLSDNSPVLEVYVSKGTQIGFNVGVSQNHIGYCIKHGIGPLLFVGGDQNMAEEEMEKRVDEMIFNSGLQDKVRANIQKKKGKSTGDRVDSKSYGGTFMRTIGPNSEAKARSFPARIVHFDEMSSYPFGVQVGDIVEKIRRRQDTYGPLKKTLGGSTPLLDGSSRIDELVEMGDKRFYNITCPKCGMQQPLLWNNLKWDKDESGKLLIEYEKINAGEEYFYEKVEKEIITRRTKIGIEFRTKKRTRAEILDI